MTRYIHLFYRLKIGTVGLDSIIKHLVIYTSISTWTHEWKDMAIRKCASWNDVLH